MALTFLNSGARAKDATVAIKYATGTLTGSSNTVTVYLRYIDANNNVSAVLTTTNAVTTIKIFETISGVVNQLGTVSGSALSSSINYFFYVKLSGTNITATVYSISGSVALGSSVLSLGPVAGQIQQRGKVGWDSALVATGSAVGYARLISSTYGVFESVVFPSITPIRGAQLSANTSLSNDLISGYTLVASGDASLISSAIAGKSGTRVIRTGASSAGGAQIAAPVEIGSSSETTIEGGIYPVNQAQGTYQAKLIDGSSNLVFAATIPSLIINQWNFFSIPIIIELLPPTLSMIVEQTGTYADEFYLSNLHLYHNTISWEASVDAGSNWQKFIKINDPKTGLKFATPNNQLKVRGTAYSDRAWIQGYSIIPLYGYPGQLIYHARFTTRDIRVIGALVGTIIATNRDIRIIGQLSSNSAWDTRISGGTSSNTSRDARTKGQLSSNIFFTAKTSNAIGTTPKVLDGRIIGQADAPASWVTRVGATLNEVVTDRDSRISGASSSLVSYSNFITGTLISSVSRDVRITAPGFSNTTRDIRVTGFSTSNLAEAIRITGANSSNVTRDVKLTAKAISSLAEDSRITGQSTSAQSADVRITGIAGTGTFGTGTYGSGVYGG